MSVPANEQIESIRAMMAAGHQSVRMERHTLLLWGITAATLIFIVDLIFNPARFPVMWQRTLFATIFMAAILTTVGVWDFRLTRKRRAQRDESVSFVQVQVTKIWWMLVGLIIVMQLGMNFFGGGFLFYGMVLGLMGIAFYIHGLFSQQMLSWIGTLMLAIGLLMVALKVPFPLQKVLAASVFGLSFPYLAIFISRESLPDDFKARSLISMGWLLLALLPALVMARWTEQETLPTGDRMTLEQFLENPDKSTLTAIVQVPTGTRVPVLFTLQGNLAEKTKTITVPVSLSRSLELSVSEGKLNGRYRIGNGEWINPERSFSLRGSRIKSTLDLETGLQVQFDARISVKE